MFLRKYLKPISFGVLLLLVVIGVVAIANPKITYAATNQDLSFEGKIVSNTGTNIADGTYNVEFTIYTGCTNEPTASTGCTAVWKEDYLTSNTTYATTVPVTFTSGTFQVNLGSICTFSGSSCEGNTNTAINWDTSPLYASINVGTTAVCAAGFTSCGGGTGAMNPYILLTASPYAMDAANADELGGIAAASYVQLSPSTQQTGNINISGTVTSGLINGQTIAGAASFGTSVTAPSLIASTGVYTGSSGGTERLDSSGNLLNIGNVTGTAAMTVQSGGSGELTLTSASGTIGLGSGTLQNTGTSVTLNIANASNSTFDVTNSLGGTASVSIDAGGSYTSAGAVSLTSGGATALSLDTGGGAAVNIAGTNATSIVLGGNTAATITEKVANSSATAFALQTAGGTSLLVANTTSSTLYIGGSATAATPVLVVFGQKTATGDPTGVSGAEYYNSANNRFRCDQGGTWVNCVPTNNSSTVAQTVAASTTAYLAGSALNIFSGGLHAGTQFAWNISLSKTGTTAATTTFLVKYGTNGTTADATEVTLATPNTGTAAADTAVHVTIMVTVRSVSAATGTWEGDMTIIHNGTLTGFISTYDADVVAVSGSFNDTTAGAIAGIAVTTGAGDGLTINQVQANTSNL